MCGKEEAVAATKSVMEQSLFFDALLHAVIGKKYPPPSDVSLRLKQVLSQPIPEDILYKIKYAQTISPQQIRGLKDFVRERKCRMDVVVNNDEGPRLYDENIIGIPFAYL